MSQGCLTCSLLKFLWLLSPRAILYRADPVTVNTSVVKIAPETISKSPWIALGQTTVQRT